MKSSLGRGLETWVLWGDFQFRVFPWIVISTTTDHGTNSPIFEPIDELSFSVDDRCVYAFEAWIIYQSNDVATGPGFAIDGPGVRDIAVHRTSIVLTDTTEFVMNGNDYDAPNTFCPTTPQANENYLAHMVGLMKTSSGSGLLRIKFRIGNVAKEITVKRGSTLTYRKIT